jgi:hypothetical protein
MYDDKYKMNIIIYNRFLWFRDLLYIVNNSLLSIRLDEWDSGGCSGKGVMTFFRKYNLFYNFKLLFNKY